MKMPWRVSIPKSRKVCGYEVRKLPLGEFLDVLEQIKEIPGLIFAECIPELALADMPGWLKGLDERQLVALLGKLLHAVPHKIVSLVARFTRLDEDQLLGDEELGVHGIAQIIRAFWEVNELEGFFSEMQALLPTSQTQRNGSKTQ